jgi:hypothetical protein
MKHCSPRLKLHGRPDAGGAARVARIRGGTVSDVLYIGLIIVVFAALWLLVKGVERFER